MSSRYSEEQSAASFSHSTPRLGSVVAKIKELERTEPTLHDLTNCLHFVLSSLSLLMPMEIKKLSAAHTWQESSVKRESML